MKRVIVLVLIASSVLFANVMNFDKNTTGLVRHMKVYKEPKWAAKIELSSGEEIYFISPKSMFEFYLRPGKWPEFNIRSEKDFKAVYVTDYATATPINAKGAFFVYGSSVTSPAGDDLVPFDSYKKAEEFSKKYNGKRIFSFREVNRGLINWLNDTL